MIELQNRLPFLEPRLRVLVKQQLETGDLHIRSHADILLLQPFAAHVDVLESLFERRNGILTFTGPLDRNYDSGMEILTGVCDLPTSVVLDSADDTVDLVPKDMEDGNLLLGQELPQVIKGRRVHVLMAKSVPLEASELAFGVHPSCVAKELLRKLDGRLDCLGLK